MRSSRMRTLSARRGAMLTGESGARRAALGTFGASGQLARDERDEAARQRQLPGPAELVARPTGEHDQLVLLAVEGLVVADLVGGDHVEILLHQLGARILLDRLGLGG